MNTADTYILYMALTKHFNSSYDFFKYNGKIRANLSNLETRKDKYMFEKLGKKRDPKGFILSNIIQNNCGWVGDLFTDKADENFVEWERRTQSLTYTFKNEIEKLDDSLMKNFKLKNGEPFIYTLFKQKEISIETLIIIMKIFFLFDRWESVFSNNIIMEEHFKLFKKYEPFVVFDKNKMKRLIKERFNFV